MTETAEKAHAAGRADASAVAIGLAAAGRAVPVALLASLPGLVFLAGSDHLAYGLGLLAGIVLAGCLIGPAIAGAGGATAADALGRRFGRPGRVPAILLVVLVAVPLLVVELSVLGAVAEALLGAPYAAAVSGGFLLAVVVAASLDETKFGWLSSAAFLVLAASLLVPLAMLALRDPGTLWPHAAHGLSLDAIRALEEKLIEAGRVDFDTFSAHATPFASLDRANVLALVVSLALGTAVMLPLGDRLASAPRRIRYLAGAWTALLVGLTLAAVPLLAAVAKLAIYTAMVSDTPLPGLPAPADLARDPLRLWLALPALAGAPGFLSPLMATGPLAAALVVSAALTRSLVRTLGGAEALSAKKSCWMLVTTALGLSAALAITLRPAELVPIAVASLSLAGAGLFPVLAIGLAWRRTTATAAAAAILVGSGVTLAYGVGTQVFPAAFYRAWPSLSNAGEYAVEEFNAREEAIATAENDDAKVAAREALDDWARGTQTRAGLANWFGIESASGAVFGLPAGLAVLLLIGFLTPARLRKDAQPNASRG